MDPRRLNALVLAVLCASGCGERPASSAAPPSHVENGVPETHLTTITLTPAAIERLGIRTAKVEHAAVDVTRLLGGELLVPPGRRMTVTAPMNAIVRAPRNVGAVPAPGTRLDAGTTVMELVPLPPDAELAALDEQLVVRETELEVARARAERAHQLLDSNVGTEETLDDARAALARAEASLNVTRSQQSALLGSHADALTTVTMRADRGGILSALHVATGQIVGAGTALFDVELQQELWVKVPIYSGDLASIDPAAPARIAKLGAWRSAQGKAAVPIQGPPTASPATLAADLYYAIDNGDGAFRPGERVQVVLRVGAASERLVVPWSAIFQDIHGGAWVYVQAQPGSYSRRRVALERVDGDRALLADAPPPGTEVVSVGVAELVGTEFGVAH
jgi:RND family efflux transporter MFP subunit